MRRGRASLSITLSKEVAEALDVFKNKSKLIDSMLSYLLLDLSKEEVFELLTNKNNDVVMYLIKRKCRELNSEIKTSISEQAVETQTKPNNTSMPRSTSKPKINPQDFWG